LSIAAAGESNREHGALPHFGEGGFQMAPPLAMSCFFCSGRLLIWLLFNGLGLGLMTYSAHSELGDDPEILRECLTITRDDTFGINLGDLKPDGVCPLRTEQGLCRSRRIRVRVENFCNRDLPLTIIKGMTGPFAIWIDRIPASKADLPSVKYFGCDEYYDQCRGIAIALRPLHRLQPWSIQLSAEDRRRLRRLLNADEFLAGMTRAAAGIDFLIDLVGPAARAPISMMIEWDKAAVEAWREVNKDLEKVHLEATCNELKMMMETSTGPRDVLQSIADARGCGAISLN
jgi:hypothetical protein